MFASTRRVTLYFVAGLISLVVARTHAAERLLLEVREMGGLARGGYPAHGLLTLPRPVPAKTSFRLVHDGRPVVAQFRPDGAEATARWWLDFQTDMKPLETRRYAVEYGEGVPPGPERTKGHALAKTDRGFTITNAPYITWTIPSDLKGFLKSVDFPPLEFLRPDSPGLILRDRKGKEHPFSGTARVLREGPMAVALRYENTERVENLRDVRSTVDLTFPVPVSWVEVEWSVDDPHDHVDALGFALDLNLEKASTAPTLVDFGATSDVYTSLRPGQAAFLNASPRRGKPGSDGELWDISRREANKETTFAVGAKSSTGRPVEGWLHVMDRKNCLALAVDSFARDTRDRIGATSDGRVTLWREYAADKPTRKKTLRMWLHFVFFPPQASAGASPQQMQSPLEVRVVEK